MPRVASRSFAIPLRGALAEAVVSDRPAESGTRCGHDPAQFVTAGGGTSYCPACEAGTGHDTALKDWREKSMPSHEELAKLHESSDPFNNALFELWRGASIVASVTAARLPREQADALLLHIACLEEDAVLPADLPVAAPDHAEKQLAEHREHSEWVRDYLKISDMDGISAHSLNGRLLTVLALADALLAGLRQAEERNERLTETLIELPRAVWDHHRDIVQDYIDAVADRMEYRDVR